MSTTLYGAFFGCVIIVSCALAYPLQDNTIDARDATTTLSTSSSSSSSSSSTIPAVILKQVDITNPDGSYNNSFETSNGIKVENVGYLKKIIVPREETADGGVNEEYEKLILVQTGSYHYTDPDGNLVELHYVADENGFQPQGAHLPVPPQ